MKLQAFCLIALVATSVGGCANAASTRAKTDDKVQRDGGSPPNPVQTPEGKDKAEDKPPKILDTAAWPSNQLAPRTGFIRGASGAAMMFGAPVDKWDDLATGTEATTKMAKVFKRDTIDWSKQMVLLVEAGHRKTSGYSVEVTGLEVKDKELIVKWKVNEPKSDSAVTEGVTYPAVALLVERFDGTITFDPPVK